MKRKMPNHAIHATVEIELLDALENLEDCEKWDVLQAMWDDLRNRGDNDEDWEGFCNANHVSFPDEDDDEDEDEEDDDEDDARLLEELLGYDKKDKSLLVNIFCEEDLDGDGDIIYWQVGEGDLHSIPPEAKVYLRCEELGCYKRVI